MRQEQRAYTGGNEVIEVIGEVRDELKTGIRNGTSGTCHLFAPRPVSHETVNLRLTLELIRPSSFALPLYPKSIKLP